VFLSVVVLQKKLPGIGGLLLFQGRIGRMEEREEGGKGGERMVRNSCFEHLFADLRSVRYA